MSSQEWLCSPHQTDTEHIIILLMEDKLKHLQKLDKLDLLDSLHAEISQIKQIISTYQTETETLKATTHKLRDDVTNLSKENKQLKLFWTYKYVRCETILFSNAFKKLKMKIQRNHSSPSSEMSSSYHRIKKITFSRFHRIGKRKTYADTIQNKKKSSGPRPIMAKFEHFKQRKLVRSLGKRIKCKPFGINKQFPLEIIKRRKVPTNLLF